jgi:hypothetical protein
MGSSSVSSRVLRVVDVVTDGKKRGRTTRVSRRDLALLCAGAVTAGVLLVPAGAHIGGTVAHLWSHLKVKVTGVAYTKAQSDARYLAKTQKAANSELVDGIDLVAQNAKVADTDLIDGVDSGQLAVPAEATHILGDPGEPALNNGSGDFGDPAGSFCNWQTFDPAGHTSPGYYQDADGVVHLQGIVKAVDGAFSITGPCGNTVGGARIFTFPEGYRPSYIRTYFVLTNNKRGRINVFPDGRVVFLNVSATSWTDAKAWFNLEDIEFRAAPQL